MEQDFYVSDIQWWYFFSSLVFIVKITCPPFVRRLTISKVFNIFSNSRRESNGYFLGGTEGYQVPFNIIYIIIDVFSRKHFNN